MQVGDKILDRYTLTEQLGEGGMGVVFRATDAEGGDVAIKQVHPEIADAGDSIARFEREAQAQALLSHPNIAGLTAVAAGPAGELCFVLELVEGPALEDVLALGPMPAPEAMAIGRQVLSALHHAHQFDMVHRDLKPQNVLLTFGSDGQRVVKLIDFGLVKLLTNVLGPEECERLTTRGVIFGTPTYMAPEQIVGDDIDARADLYAFGVMLFEMLTGGPPFDHDDIPMLLRMHLTAPVPSLGAHGTPDLEDIVRTLMAKAPDERFGSALAVMRALEAAGV